MSERSRNALEHGTKYPKRMKRLIPRLDQNAFRMPSAASRNVLPFCFFQNGHRKCDLRMSVRPHLRVAPLRARGDRLRTAQSEGCAAMAQGRQLEWSWPSHPRESICILLPLGSAGHSASADVSFKAEA